MAVNRFDKPVESEYISQYTPIPFEQLYAIGKANNEATQKAYDDLNTAFTKWAEFQSPSAVDTKRFYDLTIGAGMGFVNKLAANPDLIKTAAGRAEMQQFINSRPYAELSALKQSREGLLARLKANQQLMANGKYNPAWHDVDFANYDTIANGIYNDISPLAYKSVRELVEPYVNNLKDEYLGKQGIWDFTGVSFDRTDAQVENAWTDIYNTPELQKHLEVLLKSGVSPEQAQQLITALVYQAGREYAHTNQPTLNPLEEIKLKAQYSGKRGDGSNSDDFDVNPMRTTKQIQTGGIRSYIDGMLRLAENSSEYQKTYKDIDDAVKNGTAEDVAKARENQEKTANRLANFYMNRSVGQYIDEALRKTSSTGSITSLTNIDLANAGDIIMKEIGTRAGSRDGIPNEQADLIVQQGLDGITNVTNTELGPRRRVASTQGLIPYTDYILSLSATYGGRAAKDRYREGTGAQKISQAIRDGKFKNLIVFGGGDALTLPTQNGGDSQMTVNLAVSEAQLKSLNISAQDMVNYGAQVAYGDPKKEGQTDITIKQEDGNTTQHTSEQQKKLPRYYVLKFVTPVPGPNDGLKAQSLDQAAWQLGMSDAKRSDLYTNTQQEIYGLDTKKK